ncbi:MAG: bifunctional phosphoribosyl-AMP cyclohydrolase/phosphoribosyl-ATP diphosphatase HisIE [Bacteroidota bacterium]|nr:bifunctional phosphoribosyl-AMP cyclohydrolase/phosphoribosyl-ATP diphosphatase HisIE [Bacteroidota bacterium]
MNIDYKKYSDGLVPAIIQDANTLKVLMMGFMNEEALNKTKEIKQVTFFSRSKKRLWTKGEESGNFLNVTSMLLDCDSDTLLIKANPQGPVCHTGADTCFNEKNNSENFLFELEGIIKDRIKNPVEGSYTNLLMKKGLNKIAQKVGEEAVELVIEAKDNNKQLFLNEAADLMYHYLLLLNAKGYELKDVLDVLRSRDISK